MSNLQKLVKSVANEPKTGWIVGSPRYEILYSKYNIYRQNRTDVNVSKTAKP